MNERKISFKYDGKSEELQAHKIDALVLASSLESIANLITAADLIVNERKTDVQVNVHAGFKEGSFEVILGIIADTTLLDAIGLIAATCAGSALSLLKSLKGRTIESIELDENSDTAQIILKNGDIVDAPIQTAKLVTDKDFRKHVDRLIFQPLKEENIATFSLFDRENEDVKEVINVKPEDKGYYKRPPMIQTVTKRTAETTGTVEFLVANKDSGTSGWRMKYLGHDSVAVKILDEKFMSKIKQADAPSIFGHKFKVEMQTTQKLESGDVVSSTYNITRVIQPVKIKG